VTLYFDKPEDALRFTAAISAVLYTDTREREDVARLTKQIGKVTRVTTRGSLQSESLVTGQQ
jgi:hypothetical protein